MLPLLWLPGRSWAAGRARRSAGPPWCRWSALPECWPLPGRCVTWIPPMTAVRANWWCRK